MFPWPGLAADRLVEQRFRVERVRIQGYVLSVTRVTVTSDVEVMDFH